MRDMVLSLVRVTQVKTDEKEQKSKDFLKAQVMHFCKHSQITTKAQGSLILTQCSFENYIC